MPFRMSDTLGSVADEFTICEVVTFLTALLAAEEAATLAAMIVATAARQADSRNIAWALCHGLVSAGASGEFLRELSAAAIAAGGKR